MWRCGTGRRSSQSAGCTITEEVYQLFVAEPFELEPIRFDASRNQFNIKGRSPAFYTKAGARICYLFMPTPGNGLSSGTGTPPIPVQIVRGGGAAHEAAVWRLAVPG